MKERPILFSGPMVRAILAGRKTMTRRVVKPQPYLLYRPETYKVVVDEYGQARWMDEEGHSEHTRGWDNPAYLECPYGMPGDRLWVRETWRFGGCGDKQYRADGEVPLRCKWKPSIFMPRWASRITLEITGVCVDRLQDISVNDAREEGISEKECPNWHAVTDFAALWESINGRESWDANPWVWVVEFRKVQK
jgi:hypothetical protein